MSSPEYYRGLCPNIAPLDRIVALADIALHQEEKSRADNASVNIGKRSASIFSDDNQFMYHIEQEIAKPEIRLNLSVYALNDLGRYRSTSDKYSILTKFGIHEEVKKKNSEQPSLSKTPIQVISRWLSVLTAPAPKQADELLSAAIDQQFPATVGSFLLSESEQINEDVPARFVDFGITSPRKITDEFVQSQRGVEHDAIRDLVVDHPDYIQSFAVKHFQAQNAVNSPRQNNLKVGDADRLMIVTETMLAITDEFEESKHNTID